MIFDDTELAQLQDVMLGVFKQEEQPEKIVRQISKQITSKQYLGWVNQFDHRMLILAAQLTNKWGRFLLAKK